MKERPIVFSRPMILARRAGLKSQTRRILKLKGMESADIASVHPDGHGGWIAWSPSAVSAADTLKVYPDGGGFKCPYGVVGDRLWHKETWSTSTRWNHTKPSDLQLEISDIFFAADYDEKTLKELKPWRPSLCLPRRYSRWTDEITDIRVERLQDISEEDAKAEGASAQLYFCPPDGGERQNLGSGGDTWNETWGHIHYKNGFANLWESINGPGSWASNPWVWGTHFKAGARMTTHPTNTPRSLPPVRDEAVRQFQTAQLLRLHIARKEQEKKR